MKNSRLTDIAPAVEQLFEQLNLREPSCELDQKIAAMSRSVRIQPAPMKRESHSLGWPAIASIALVSCLLGIVVGSRIDAGISSLLNPIDSTAHSSVGATTDHRNQDHGNRTPVSYEIESSVAAFNWIHGHSIESANQHCADCHLFQEPATDGNFYDRKILAQHPEYFPKCSRCHTGVTVNWNETKSNS